MHQGIGGPFADGRRLGGDGMQRQILGVALTVSSEEWDDQVGQEHVEDERDEGGDEKCLAGRSSLVCRSTLLLLGMFKTKTSPVVTIQYFIPNNNGNYQHTLAILREEPMAVQKGRTQSCLFSIKSTPYAGVVVGCSNYAAPKTPHCEPHIIPFPSDTARIPQIQIDDDADEARYP